MPERGPYRPKNSSNRPNSSSQSPSGGPNGFPQYHRPSHGMKRKRTPPLESVFSVARSPSSGERKVNEATLNNRYQGLSSVAASKSGSQFKNLIRPASKTSPRKEERLSLRPGPIESLKQLENLQRPTSKSVSSKKPKDLQAARKDLPIWTYASSIGRCLENRDVLILVGETGSGKSTQVPQFLLSQAWCKPRMVKILSSKGAGPQDVEVGGCIAVTEPRRVAAISLAHRVASEMGESLTQGSIPGRVGYSVRFDSKISSNTRIKFLTEGMLLQELLRDPWLKQYSAVVVDEIHERGVNVDLVAGFLKNIVAGKKEGRGGVPLKVAIMSATADMEGLQRFFESSNLGGKIVNGASTETHKDDSRELVNGKAKSTSFSTLQNNNMFSSLLANGYRAENNQIESDYSGDSLSWSGISTSDDETEGRKMHAGAAYPTLKQIRESKQPLKLDSLSQTLGVTSSSGREKHSPELGQQRKKEEQRMHQKNMSSNSFNTKFGEPSDIVSTLHIEGRQYPVNVLYAEEPVHDFVDAALRTIFQIHYGESLPGDVLVFLTGQDDIEALDKLVNDYAAAMGPEVPKILSIPLFAALSNVAQQKIFQPTPPRTRKIIIATNVAETSITVPGVRYVVDCGKAKIKQFRARIGLDSLLVKPISKSAAIQRKGRAGREAAGTCYRLYTEKEYLKLDEINTPEILRCNVAEPVLTIKARGVDDILSFPFLDSPGQDALRSSLLQLLQLGALTETGHISELGKSMAKLPLSPMLGRVLLAAAHPDRGCIAEAIDIISCLSVDNNIFQPLTSEEKREEAEAARKELSRREGDHITLLKTVQRYLAEETNRRVWSEKHFISHRAMQAVMDIRKQLRAYCQNNKLLKSNAEINGIIDIDPERANLILRCFLEAYSSHTARIMPDGSYKTLVGNQTVAIHPSSGLFGRRVEAIMYHEYVYTTKSYAKNVSAVQLDWVDEVMARDVVAS